MRAFAGHLVWSLDARPQRVEVLWIWKSAVKSCERVWVLRFVPISFRLIGSYLALFFKKTIEPSLDMAKVERVSVNQWPGLMRREH